MMKDEGYEKWCDEQVKNKYLKDIRDTSFFSQNECRLIDEAEPKIQAFKEGSNAVRDRYLPVIEKLYEALDLLLLEIAAERDDREIISSPTPGMLISKKALLETKELLK